MWKIWTRSVLFLFAWQSSLENSVSTERLETHAHNTQLSITPTHTFGFHPKYHSTRLVRFSENYWHSQASSRVMMSYNLSFQPTLFWKGIFHHLTALDEGGTAHCLPLAAVVSGAAGAWILTSPVPCMAQGQQHSRDLALSLPLHKAALMGCSSVLIY